jgi:hypothetical protein
MRNYFMAMVLASIGCLLGASGCTVDAGVGAPTDQELGGESVGSISSEFSVETCGAYDAYDHFIGETWSHQAIFSDKVDLLDMNDPAYFVYNAYNYDYSGVCPQAFVTDVIARPSGNPAMTARLTLKQGAVTGAMNPTRCGNIYFQFAVYGQKFNRDGVWRHIENAYVHGSYANGRCTLPIYTSRKIDWKDGLPGIGKLGGLRFVMSAGEGDTLYKTCLAIDPDDQGDHLNSLCPPITL